VFNEEGKGAAGEKKNLKKGIMSQKKKQRKRGGKENVESETNGFKKEKKQWGQKKLVQGRRKTGGGNGLELNGGGPRPGMTKR